MEGFVYPNETVLQWGLLIVIYPYITGLVAGAFVVSSLYHVFGVTSFRPVARLSLVTALSFALVCPLPLLLHLGRPERAFEIFLSPNLTSAMSMFGYIWLFYVLLLVVETWLVFRADIVASYHKATHGLAKLVYGVAALGVYDVSDKSLHNDQRLVKVLATAGIPAACLLHGYVGFIFGAVSANAWWSTPLMPIIFLLSAIVSGMALLLLLYIVVSSLRGASPEYGCVRSLCMWLGGFLTLAVTLEGLELMSMVYVSEESWDILSQLVTEKIAGSYFGLQFGLGAGIPLVVLGLAVLFKLRAKIQTATAVLSSTAILIGVFAMRWNVVIGGQLFSKSLRGFSTYVPELMGSEGVVAAAALLALPLVILAVVCLLIPPWHTAPEAARGHAASGSPGYSSRPA